MTTNKEVITIRYRMSLVKKNLTSKRPKLMNLVKIRKIHLKLKKLTKRVKIMSQLTLTSQHYHN